MPHATKRELRGGAGGERVCTSSDQRGRGSSELHAVLHLAGTRNISISISLSIGVSIPHPTCNSTHYHTHHHVARLPRPIPQREVGWSLLRRCGPCCVLKLLLPAPECASLAMWMPFWICLQEKAHAPGEIYQRRELSARAAFFCGWWEYKLD
jgi:hypothetical protein